jgi:hypothetical protein
MTPKENITGVDSMLASLTNLGWPAIYGGMSNGKYLLSHPKGWATDILLFTFLLDKINRESIHAEDYLGNISSG